MSEITNHTFSNNLHEPVVQWITYYDVFFDIDLKLS